MGPAPSLKAAPAEKPPTQATAWEWSRGEKRSTKLRHTAGSVATGRCQSVPREAFAPRERSTEQQREKGNGAKEMGSLQSPKPQRLECEAGHLGCEDTKPSVNDENKKNKRAQLQTTRVIGGMNATDAMGGNSVSSFTQGWCDVEVRACNACLHVCACM